MLDIRSLSYAVALSMIMGALGLALLHRRDFHFQGPGWWALGCLSFGVGLLLHVLRGYVPEAFSIVAGNVLIMVSYVLTAHGMRLFMGGPGLSRRAWAGLGLLLAAVGATLFWYSYAIPFLYLRYVVIMSVLAGVSLLAGLPLLRAPGAGRTVRLAGAWYVFNSLLTLAFIFRPRSSFEGVTYLSSGNLSGYYVLWANVFGLGCVFFMIRMISQRLQSGLVRQNALLQENIRLREEMDVMGRHDLKTPLNSIISIPQLVLQDRDLSENNRRYMELIQQSGYMMLDMVNLSLDLHKMERGSYQRRLESFDLFEVLERVVNDHRGHIRSKRLRVDLRKAGPGGEAVGEVAVLGERLLAYSMFSNLVKNALEASPTSETVAVSVVRNDHTVVEITNSGVVPEQLRATFFDKYSRWGKANGIGMGTYSARLMAQVQGWSVDMRTSDADGRTTVSVAIPA